MEVTRLQCRNCGSELSGHFSLGRFAALRSEQWQFVEVFLKQRGSLKAVGEELKMSYPTVINRLNEILTALGLPTDEANVPEQPSLSPERRREILNDLAAKKISADEAARMLRTA
jgi:hypothetical protein